MKLKVTWREKEGERERERERERENTNILRGLPYFPKEAI